MPGSSMSRTGRVGPGHSLHGARLQEWGGSYLCAAVMRVKKQEISDMGWIKNRKYRSMYFAMSPQPKKSSIS